MFKLSERDISNREKVKEIVLEYFNLDSESRKRFLDVLENPFIDPFYKSIASDKDSGLRIRKHLPADMLSSIDSGWSIFSSYFPEFILKYDIKYKDFNSNVVEINKNKVKILKALKEFYFENDNELLTRTLAERVLAIDYDTNGRSVINISLLKRRVKDLYQNIAQNKLPKGESVEVVISLNFVDWFMCAVGEKWTSCLDFERSEYSGATWSGLPGTIVDKNRAMLYITNGSKKVYRGIKTDRFIYRTWLLLDNLSNLNVVRWFPSRPFGTNILRKTFSSHRVININRDFFSKYYIDLLKFDCKRKYSCFIFQDKTLFCKNKAAPGESCYKRYLLFDSEGEHGALQYIDTHGNLEYKTIFNYCDGLNGLIENEECLNDEKTKEACRCISCDILGEAMTYHAGEWWCQDCFSERFYVCASCSTIISKYYDSYTETEHGVFCAQCESQNVIVGQTEAIGTDIHLTMTTH